EGESQTHIRALLHNQVRGTGHGSGTVDQLRDHRTAPRQDSCPERSGTGQRLHRRASGATGESGSMKKRYELLLVDDEIANLQKLQRTFVDNYSVHLARSASEALEILRRAPIDAIITDQKMPEMTGIELLEASERDFPNLVRIVLTGYTEVD